MVSIIGALFGLAAIGVYIGAVRQEKTWGTPVMGGLAALAVVLVLWPLTPMHGSLQQWRTGVASQQHMALLGETLGPELSAGARVLFIINYDGGAIDDGAPLVPPGEEMPPGEGADDTVERERMIEQELDEMIAVFQEHTGVTIDVVDRIHIDAMPLSADAVNASLERYRNQNVDLILTEQLPRDDQMNFNYQLRELECLDWPSEPALAGHAGSNYNPEGLRESIEAGLLRAVTLQTSADNMIVVGPDNVDHIPSHAVFGPYSE